MIICHQHRYVFIEIPLTASWSIHHELCNNYGGEPILHKHANYAEFKRQASSQELDYFVFATVRNPLDVVISQYYKYKTNHRNAFSDPEALQATVVEATDLKKFQYLQSSNASFQDYFLKYFHQPYASMIDLSRPELDYVLRFEQLQHDFSILLQKLGLEQVRLLPVSNQTAQRQRDWRTYYTPEIIPRAKQVFGPYMQAWDYAFPEAWGPHQVSALDQARYRLRGWLRHYYYLYIRYHNHALARALRTLRARLK